MVFIKVEFLDVLQFSSLQGIKSYRLFFILIDGTKKKLKGEKVYMLFLSKKQTFSRIRQLDSFLAPNFRRFNPFLAPNFRKTSIFAPDYQCITNYEKISKKTYRQRT